MSDVIAVFETALGEGPAALAASGRPLGEPEVWRLISVRSSIPVEENLHVPQHEVWPLISHHSYGNRGLFGQSESGHLVPRVLRLLLRHDGIVAADPLSDLTQLAKQGRMVPAVRFIRQVVGELTEVEPLIRSGSLRFTKTRPSLSEANRQAVLDVFGLDPSLEVFRNFLDAAPSVASVPEAFAREYAPQVRELFARLGVPQQACHTLEDAVRAVKELAAAVIEVSWQFAVCAETATADLAFRRGLEADLAKTIFEATRKPTDLTRAPGAARHFARFELGDVPNLDADRLTMADAVAIRWDDSFAAFRDLLRAAIDDLERDQDQGRDPWEAQASFEERMRDGAEALRTKAKRSSFGGVVASAAVPAGLIVATDVALAGGPTALGSAAAGAVSVASTAVQHWLTCRQTTGAKVARRYCALLEGP